MTKTECERAIRSLCYQWKSTHHACAASQDLRFSDFCSWLEQNHPELLQLRSVLPAIDVVEIWFDQEFQQTWRN